MARQQAAAVLEPACRLNMLSQVPTTYTTPGPAEREECRSVSPTTPARRRDREPGDESPKTPPRVVRADRRGASGDRTAPAKYAPCLQPRRERARRSRVRGQCPPGGRAADGSHSAPGPDPGARRGRGRHDRVQRDPGEERRQPSIARAWRPERPPPRRSEPESGHRGAQVGYARAGSLSHPGGRAHSQAPAAEQRKSLDCEGRGSANAGSEHFDMPVAVMPRCRSIRRRSLARASGRSDGGGARNRRGPRQNRRRRNRARACR